MRTLKVGIWINIVMGICGWVGYYFASSFALALDGSLCAISAVSFIIALYITRERDVTSDESAWSSLAQGSGYITKSSCKKPMEKVLS